MHDCISCVSSIFYSGVVPEVRPKSQHVLFKDKTPISATTVISDPMDSSLVDEDDANLVISTSSVFADISCLSMPVYLCMFPFTG